MKQKWTDHAHLTQADIGQIQLARESLMNVIRWYTDPEVVLRELEVANDQIRRVYRRVIWSQQ